MSQTIQIRDHITILAKDKKFFITFYEMYYIMYYKSRNLCACTFVQLSARLFLTNYLSTVAEDSMKQRNFRLFIANLLFFLAIPAVASAAVLEEIVVIAQKREQNLQDVSVTVTAFTGDTIEKLGIQDPRDIANLMPNVAVQTSENTSTFNIRGVQLLDTGDGNESPVSFYIDEIYYGTLGGQSGPLFDIQRAEVLRGPQGTLFGRNSTAGLVHFITRKPTDDFDARGSFEYGSDNERIGTLAVGGSLTDGVRGRVAGKIHKRDGWQKGGFGQELGTADSWSLRGMLEFDVTDNLTALVSLSGSSIDDNPAALTSVGLHDPGINVPLFPGGPVGFPVPCAQDSEADQARILRGDCVNFSGAPSSTDPERSGTDVTQSNDITLWGASFRLSWEINDSMQLTSITAYNEVDKETVGDADGSTYILGTTDYNVTSEVFSQEIRLNGESDRLNWVAGAYYYDDAKDKLQFLVPNVVALFGGGNSYGFNSDAMLDTTSWALFGQVEYALNDQWSLIAGVRYSDEEKDLLISDDLDNPSVVPGTTEIFLVTEKFDESEVTGRVGVDWRPIDDTLVFLSISTGYKSGAFNTQFPVLGNSAPTDSETVTNYELGVKTTLLDGNLRWNASVFYSDYSDVQASALIPGTVTATLVNVGDVDIYGFELESTWRVNDNIEAILNMGVLDSEISSEEAVYDRNDLPYSPPLSVNAIVNYTFPVEVFGGELTWTNAVKYVSEHDQTAQNEFTSVQESYVVWDTLLRWVSEDARYYVEGFIKNANDEEYTIDRFQVSGGPLGWAGLGWGRTRHGGVRVGFDF